MPAPTGPFIGKGLIFSGSPDGVTYTPYAKVMDLKPAPAKVADVEVTTYDGTIEAYIAGWKNVGEAEGEINYDYTQSSALNALVGVAHYWKIQFPDGSSASTGTALAFQGYLNQFQPKAPIKGRMSSGFKIRLTSDVIWTAAS